MANQQAREGILHVPGKGGVQHRARNSNGRSSGSRQGFRDTSGEQVQPMQQGEDPALAPFLQVLDDHVSSHPEQLQPMTTDLVAHLDHLVGAVDVDLDAPLEADDEDKDHATL